MNDPGPLGRGQQTRLHCVPGALRAHPPAPGPDRLPRPEHLRNFTPDDTAAVPVNDSRDYLPSITKRSAFLACSYRQQILDQRPRGALCTRRVAAAGCGASMIDNLLLFAHRTDLPPVARAAITHAQLMFGDAALLER